MSAIEIKSMNDPDETRTFDKGIVDLTTVGGVTFSRLTLEPGWTWSTCVKPVAKTHSCQVHHTGYVIAGRMRVRMDSGEEVEYGPDDAYVIPPGHDAWIVGDERYVGVDVSGDMLRYAK